jgi:hypothetical protein
MVRKQVVRCFASVVLCLGIFVPLLAQGSEKAAGPTQSAAKTIAEGNLSKFIGSAPKYIGREPIANQDCDGDIIGDLDGDGLVDDADLSGLLSRWGTMDTPKGFPVGPVGAPHLNLLMSLFGSSYCCTSQSIAQADIDRNGVVDGADLISLLNSWGSKSPKLVCDGQGVNEADLHFLLGQWSAGPVNNTPRVKNRCAKRVSGLAHAAPYADTLCSSIKPRVVNRVVRSARSDAKLGKFGGDLRKRDCRRAEKLPKLQRKLERLIEQNKERREKAQSTLASGNNTERQVWVLERIIARATLKINRAEKKLEEINSIAFFCTLAESAPRTDQISQWGITFYFDKPYSYGQFANGDYWVAPDSATDSVTIVSISPDAISGRNGWTVNPTRCCGNGNKQPYDHRANLYSPALMPSLPYQALAGDSIVKARSVPAGVQCSNPVNLRCLETAAVLTILDEAPPLGGANLFRPSVIKPAAGQQKPLHSVDQINWSKIPSFAPPQAVQVPLISDLLNSIKRFQLDNLAVHDARHRPIENMPGYGADIARRNTEVLMRLVLDDPTEDKRDLTIALIQMGLDLNSFLRDGSGWLAAGGHGFGRLLPIVFAASLLNDEEIRADLLGAHPNKFGETSAVYISPTDGEAYYGEAHSNCGSTPEQREFQYWNAMKTHAVARSCRDPYQADGPIDGGERAGHIYQTCCSSGYMQGLFVGFKLMPALEETFYHEAFMKYAERWIRSGTSTANDTCAPAVGRCVGGPNDGLLTTGALGFDLCLGGGGQFEADMSLYGIMFGPDGNGGCIQDDDPSDGIGRFPFQHGKHSNWGMTPFQKAMQNSYLALSSPELN